MTNLRTEVGARLRSARQQRGQSLAHVAQRAGISVATLSRIETSVQSIDVDLLGTIARILGVPPSHLLSDDGAEQNLAVLAERVAALRAADRAKLLQSTGRRRRGADLATLIDDVMSTLDLVREELEEVARAARKRRRR